ncbi:hypothetical protein FQA39_LY01056 [Lamprigera yunnana]|nr:hypothetical protein FQA39_LY01056 [Lamprigera yunnana]
MEVFQGRFAQLWDVLLVNDKEIRRSVKHEERTESLRGSVPDRSREFREECVYCSTDVDEARHVLVFPRWGEEMVDMETEIGKVRKVDKRWKVNNSEERTDEDHEEEGRGRGGGMKKVEQQE